MRWKQDWHQGRGIGIAMLAVALATACAGERAAGPRGDHVITMRDHMIEPESLTAKPGETVVWYNATPGSDALILFEKGKVVFQACAHPVGFIRSAGGDYYTGPLGYGAEASLCFPAPGTYEYQIILYRGGRDSSSHVGRIIVK